MASPGLLIKRNGRVAAWEPCGRLAETHTLLTLLARQTAKAEQGCPHSRIQRRMGLVAKDGNQASIVHQDWRIPKVAHFGKLPEQRHEWRQEPYQSPRQLGDLDPRIAGV